MTGHIDTILQAIAFIETHLQSAISVADMAESAGYSLFHFIRMFNHSVHQTPYDYLMRRRLTEAARALSESKQRIIDVCMAYGFASQESFSRAFKRMLGMQPSQWRGAALLDDIRLMPSITSSDLLFIAHKDFQYPLVEHLPPITLLGMMTPLEGNIQTQQAQHKKLLDDFIENHGRNFTQYFMVTSRFTTSKVKAYLFCGVQRDAISAAYPPFGLQCLPEGTYVKIATRAQFHQAALRYLYHTWLPKTAFTSDGKLEVALITPQADADTACDLYIPLG